MIFRYFMIEVFELAKMENPTSSDVNQRPRYVFKRNPFISQVYDPFGAFSQVPENVLHVEDIKSYI